MMSGQFALNTVEWYDVATNSWRRANSMIHRRQGCCACVIDGLLYGSFTLCMIAPHSDLRQQCIWLSAPTVHLTASRADCQALCKFAAFSCVLGLAFSCVLGLAISCVFGLLELCVGSA